MRTFCAYYFSSIVSSIYIRTTLSSSFIQFPIVSLGLDWIIIFSLCVGQPRRAWDASKQSLITFTHVNQNSLMLCKLHIWQKSLNLTMRGYFFFFLQSCPAIYSWPSIKHCLAQCPFFLDDLSMILSSGYFTISRLYWEE